MNARRPRLTIRRMMIAVALAALILLPIVTVVRWRDQEKRRRQMAEARMQNMLREIRAIFDEEVPPNPRPLDQPAP